MPPIGIWMCVCVLHVFVEREKEGVASEGGRVRERKTERNRDTGRDFVPYLGN